jgi:hypothetical protein
VSEHTAENDVLRMGGIAGDVARFKSERLTRRRSASARSAGYVAPLPATSVIRAWAIANGYLPPHQRYGRIPSDVIDCFREAAS